MEQTYVSILEGLEHLSQTQGCEYCGILNEYSIIQSEIQKQWFFYRNYQEPWETPWHLLTLPSHIKWVSEV